MQSRAWLNLLMLFVLVAVAALIYFEPGLENEAVEAQTLTELSPSAIKHLKIENRHGVVELVRKDEQWWLVRDVPVVAGAFRVEMVTALLSSVSDQRYVLSGDLAGYGLDEPRVRLTVENVSLLFGGRDPLAQRRYVAVGDVLHLVSLADFAVLEESAAFFVDLHLLADGDVLERIELPGGDVLTRSTDGWQYQGGQSVQSNDQLTELITQWRHASAIKVSELDGDIAPLHVVIERNGGQKLDVGVLETESELILQRPDLKMQYHFGLDYKKRLLQLGPPIEGGVGE